MADSQKGPELKENKIWKMARNLPYKARKQGGHLAIKGVMGCF
jgi:hypothetical protein